MDFGVRHTWLVIPPVPLTRTNLEKLLKVSISTTQGCYEITEIAGLEHTLSEVQLCFRVADMESKKKESIPCSGWASGLPVYAHGI